MPQETEADRMFAALDRWQASKWSPWNLVPPDPDAIVMPFGKHKGRTLAKILAADHRYVDWLLTRRWMFHEYGELREAIARNCPEHPLATGRPKPARRTGSPAALRARL